MGQFSLSMGPIPATSTKCFNNTNSHTQPSLETIKEESHRLFSNSMADSTWKSYSRARAALESFQHLYALEKVWPVPFCQLVLLIAYLSLKKFSPSTIRSYISGISFSHKAMDITDPTKNFIIRKILEVVMRNSHRMTSRTP